MDQEILLRIEDLKKYFLVEKGLFSTKKDIVRAVDGITFHIRHNEVLSLVGESGCGKSTTGRLILRLIEPTDGKIVFMGEDIIHIDKSRLKSLRRHMQIIFQDPFASLNPRMTVKDIIEEPLLIHKVGSKKDREEEVAKLLRKVGLSPDHMNRYPHEFSGGQRQRIGLARAIALKPKLIVADEPVSALDVSIQAQIINLFQELKEEFHISYLFITHDLNVVRSISTKVAVMYLGKIMEMASVTDLYKSPLHPYTQALFSAIPIPDPRRRNRDIILLEGDVPSPVHIPSGCRFHTRCPEKIQKCTEVIPPLEDFGNSHLVACIRAREWA